MAFDFGGIAGVAFTWMQTGLFWIVVVFVMVVGFFGALIIRKRRKMQYSAIEMVDLGNGKMGISTKGKCGWMKSKKILFGLWDYGGEESLFMNDGRKILNASSEDFHDINGKRGVVVQRKGDDYKILALVSRLKTSNYELIAQLAPADYRDASTDIINRANKEMTSMLEKILPYAMIILVAICLLISIILIVQMVQHSQDKIADTIIKVADALHTTPSAIEGTAP